MNKPTPDELDELARIINRNPDKLDGGEYYDAVEDASEQLRAYAATLRQQGEQAGGVVSRDLLAKACQARNKESERARKAGEPRNETAELRAALQAALAQNSQTQHPDDAAVDCFAAALKAKLAEARAKGRGGWQDKDDCPQQRLSDMLRAHVEKGDPRDVANFCMFLHQRGESILPAQNAQGEAVARLKAVIERDRTAFCGLIVQLKGELQSRAWLGDENARAAGGYTYDEPGFIREFGDAWTAIMSALERAHRTFQDFADCPSGEAIRSAQADARAILDRHAERARVPEGWVVVKEHAWDHGDGGRPTLAYLWPSEFERRVFPSFEQASAFIREHEFPLGWVAMKLAAAPSRPEAKNHD